MDDTPNKEAPQAATTNPAPDNIVSSSIPNGSSPTTYTGEAIANTQIQKATFSWRNVLGLVGISLLANVLTVGLGVALLAIFKTGVKPGSGLEDMGTGILLAISAGIIALIAQPFMSSFLAKKFLKINATKIIFIVYIPAYLVAQFAGLASDYTVGVIMYVLALFIMFYFALKALGAH